MIRILTLVLSCAALAAVIAHELFTMRVVWGVPLAILVAGGGLVACALIVRSSPNPPAPRARGETPRDPGIPRPPLGAPYRGT